jgi:hypothetical protein
MLKLQLVNFLPETLQIVLQDTGGLTSVVDGRKKHQPRVKKIATAVSSLPPKRECWVCKGFGEVGMSGDRCLTCAGMGYTRS